MTQSNKKNTQRAAYILEGSAALLLLLLVSAVLFLHFTRPEIPYSAQAASLDETVQAKVLQVNDSHIAPDQSGMLVATQELEMEITSRGESRGQRITVNYQGMGPTEQSAAFRAGESALVMVSQRPDGQTFYAVADHVRMVPLGLLTLIFVVVTAIVGRWQGVRAVLGLVLSIMLIGGFILPQIMAMRNPVMVTLVGSAMLLAVTLYLIQGWNPVGHTALLGMLISLAFTGLLSVGWTHYAYLSGFGSEEVLYLQAVGVVLDMRGLLLAGMILGAAGVLDDVVLAQAMTAFEIAEIDPTLSVGEIYKRGMKVGVAHLTSMVNTLVLAYASSALPLIILFYLYPEPWYLTINRELIAEEVVRTLVGSLGLMLAVPLTTAIAAWAAPLVAKPAE